MAQLNQPAGLEPGIYFDLEEEKYHADTALSHGGMVHLLEGGYLHYWMKSIYNPDRAMFKATDAMTFGHYCHGLLLDEKNFLKKYSCTSAGYNPNKPMRQLINKTLFDKVKESVDEIKRVPKAHDMFKQGYPEVTIIWIDPDTGVRLRIRIDWIRVFGGIDYKRAKSIQNNPLGWHITDFGYDIQQVLYSQGIAEAKRLLRAGNLKVFGKPESMWLAKFISEERVIFRFLFQRSERPFVFRILKLDDTTISNAAVHITDAKKVFIDGMVNYGTKRPDAGTGETEEFSHYHLPRRIIDRGDNLYS